MLKNIMRCLIVSFMIVGFQHGAAASATIGNPFDSCVVDGNPLQKGCGNNEAAVAFTVEFYHRAFWLLNMLIHLVYQQREQVCLLLLLQLSM